MSDLNQKQTQQRAQTEEVGAMDWELGGVNTHDDRPEGRLGDASALPAKSEVAS